MVLETESILKHEDLHTSKQVFTVLKITLTPIPQILWMCKAMYML